MPRIARITLDNTCYHIITRGNQKQPVFLETKDFRRFIFLLNRCKRRFKFKLYSFCLMPNHVHLMLEVEKSATLQRIMRSLNLSYTLYFNFKYNKVGHLWQDRYKSRIIEKDKYFFKCIEYIESNPQRACLAKDITAYPWNSYVFRTNQSAILDDLSCV